MGKHSVSYPVQEFMLKTDILKNGMSHIGLYGSASPCPPPRVSFLLSRQKNVRTANAGRTAL